MMCCHCACCWRESMSTNCGFFNLPRNCSHSHKHLSINRQTGYLMYCMYSGRVHVAYKCLRYCSIKSSSSCSRTDKTTNSKLSVAEGTMKVSRVGEHLHKFKLNCEPLGVCRRHHQPFCESKLFAEQSASVENMRPRAKLCALPHLSNHQNKVICMATQNGKRAPRHASSVQSSRRPSWKCVVHCRWASGDFCALGCEQLVGSRHLAWCRRFHRTCAGMRCVAGSGEGHQRLSLHTFLCAINSSVSAFVHWSLGTIVA